MKNKIISAVAFMLSVTLLMGSIAGCGKKEAVVIEPMEIETVYKQTFDAIGGDDVLPVAGFYMPLEVMSSINGNVFPDYNEEKYYKLIADSGVNLICYATTDYAKNPKAVLKSLDLAQKYGIGMNVLDTGVTGMAGSVNSDLTLEEALERMKDYMFHPAFTGMYMYDEPGTDYYQAASTHRLSEYSNISDILNNKIGVWSYQNLYAIGASIDDSANFNKYLKEYCETNNPKHILADRYMFDRKLKGTENVHLYFLSTVRKYANKYNIPFWNFVQAGSQWNDNRNYFKSEEYFPDEMEFSWAINISLVMGAKGIVYFPMFQPYFFAYGEEEGVYDFQRNGIIGAWGNKTRWYAYSQNITPHLRAIDEVLMNSVNKGVLATGKDSKEDAKDMVDGTLIEGSGWRELKSVNGDAIIGCFNYNGKTALYVMNYSHKLAQNIELEFHNKYDIKMVQNGKTEYVNADSLKLDMAAGSAVLLVIGG